MIGILTVSHKRPKIDKAFCLMIDRIMKDYPGIFLPACAVSLPEEKKHLKSMTLRLIYMPTIR